MVNKAILHYNDSTLNLTFKVPSLKNRETIWKIQEKYKDVLSIIDSKLDLLNIDWSGLNPEQIQKLDGTKSVIESLSIIQSLKSNNPEIIEKLVPKQLTYEDEKNITLFYLEMLQNCIDLTKLESNIAELFEGDILESEFFNNLDTEEVAILVYNFRKYYKPRY